MAWDTLRGMALGPRNGLKSKLVVPSSSLPSKAHSVLLVSSWHSITPRLGLSWDLGSRRESSLDYAASTRCLASS